MWHTLLSIKQNKNAIAKSNGDTLLNSAIEQHMIVGIRPGTFLSIAKNGFTCMRACVRACVRV